jgi:hypothetical protein
VRYYITQHWGYQKEGLIDNRRHDRNYLNKIVTMKCGSREETAIMTKGAPQKNEATEIKCERPWGDKVVVERLTTSSRTCRRN